MKKVSIARRIKDSDIYHMFIHINAEVKFSSPVFIILKYKNFPNRDFWNKGKYLLKISNGDTLLCSFYSQEDKSYLGAYNLNTKLNTEIIYEYQVGLVLLDDGGRIYMKF